MDLVLRLFCNTCTPSVCFESQRQRGKPTNSYAWYQGRCSAAHVLEGEGSTSSAIRKTAERCFWDTDPQFLGREPVEDFGDYGLSLTNLIAPGSVIDLWWGFWPICQRMEATRVSRIKSRCDSSRLIIDYVLNFDRLSPLTYIWAASIPCKSWTYTTGYKVDLQTT
jgi:hypothetical protein